MPINTELLYRVKQAYVAPPTEFVDPASALQMPPQEQQQAPPQDAGAPQNPEQVAQIMMEGIQQGMPMEQIAEALAQQGVNPQLIAQVGQQIEQQMGQQGGQQGGQQAPTEEPASQEPLDIRTKVHEEIQAEKKRRNIPPEDRLDVMERQLNYLIDIVEGLVNGGSMPKEASDHTYIQATIEALKKD